MGVIGIVDTVLLLLGRLNVGVSAAKSLYDALRAEHPELPELTDAEFILRMRSGFTGNKEEAQAELERVMQLITQATMAVEAGIFVDTTPDGAANKTFAPVRHVLAGEPAEPKAAPAPAPHPAEAARQAEETRKANVTAQRDVQASGEPRMGGPGNAGNA